MLKRILFMELILILLITSYNATFAEDFPIVWSKTMPNTASIPTILFSHNSEWILCYKGANQNALIYDVETGDLLREDIVFELEQPILSNDDSHLYGINGNKITYCNMETGEDESKFEHNDSSIITYDVSIDEKYIVTFDGKTLKIWDNQTGIVIRSIYIEIDTKDLIYEEYIVKINNSNSKIYFMSVQNYQDMIDNHWSKSKLTIFNFNNLSDNEIFTENIVRIYPSLNGDIIALAYVDNHTPIFEVFDFTSNQTIKKVANTFWSERWASFTSDRENILINIYSGSERGIILWNIETNNLTKIFKNRSYDACNISSNQKFVVASVGNNISLTDISSINSVNDIELIKTLYPNPTDGKISIDLNNDYTPLNVIISDLKAHTIKVIESNKIISLDDRIQIFLNDIPSGTYLLQLTYPNETVIYKIILSK